MKILPHDHGRPWLALVAGLAIFFSTGCNKFLDVTNTRYLETSGIDPEKDAQVLTQSVYQQFVSDEGNFAVYSAWYTGSAWVGDTYPTRNDFGRRDIPDNNTHINAFWGNLADNIQFARSTITAIESAGNTIGLARSYFAAGYSILFQADMFCEGTIAESTLVPRGPMTTNQLLDSAITSLKKAQDVANAVGGSDGSAIAMAAQVGIARAYLQSGQAAAASAAAAQVPADFVYSLWHLDDPSNRALGNGVYNFTEARVSLVVPPALRAIADAGDPRIAYKDMGRPAQDGVLEFYAQQKYLGWGVAERLASGLEARYIKAEADGDAAEILSLVNERRAVGGEAPLTTNDMTALMTELMRQKTLDFWLENTIRMEDFRRVPQYMSYVVPVGNDTYYKPELGPVKNESCWPVPQSEKRNNPNFGGA